MTGPGLRRRALLGLAGGVPLAAAAAGPAGAQAAGPLTLRLLDLTGTPNGAQLLDPFAYDRPDLVARVEVTRDHAEVLFGSIRAAVAAGAPPYDLVLTNLDGAVMGAELGLWQPMGSRLRPLLPPMDDLLTPLARLLRGAVREQAQIILASPGGPLLTYAPERVPRVPRTAEELLAWARAHPRRFLYPRPEYSEAGRCFVAGLPWILQDRDPHDPVDGWPRTWAYLAELDRHVAYYPTTTRTAMEELAEGAVDIVPTTIGLDVFARGTGMVPDGVGLAALQDMHWVPVGVFAAVMRGLPAERLATITLGLASLLEAPVQRKLFGRGLYWPGPVRDGVALDDAPPPAQAELRRLVRPGTAALLAGQHFAPPLLLEETLAMLRRWDEDISAWHGVRR